MEPMRLADVAAAVGATVPEGFDPDLTVGPDVGIDSRAATPGSLFVALPGDRADGHSYVAAAAANGAAAALVNADLPGAGKGTGDACAAGTPGPRFPGAEEEADDLCTGDTPAPAFPGAGEGTGGAAPLRVPDPLTALADLARHVVATLPDLTRIALTGSSGKTTTKDLLAHVLAQAGATVAPQNSFNNEIGVPLTALRATRDTRFLISELGARAPGHITLLTDIVRPVIGLVLNIGHAHVGEFGGPGATARAKGELVAALPDRGWAVLNADDPLVWAMRSRHRGPVAAFSVSGEAPAEADLAVWATDVRADDDQLHSFTLHVRREGAEGTAPVALVVPGRHQVANAAAAAATALAAGLDLGLVARALGGARVASHWRLEVTERAGLTVVNDAYNANPDSMRAALDFAGGLLRSRRRRDPATRLVAVLGDMLELGPDSAEFHEAAGRQAVAAGATALIAVGDFGPDLIRGARGADPGVAVELARSRDDAVSAVRNVAAPAIVLVKASRGVGLESVAEALAVPVAAKDEAC